MTPKRAHNLLTALTFGVFMATGHSQHVDVYVLVGLIAAWLVAISWPPRRGLPALKPPGPSKARDSGMRDRRWDDR